MQDIVEEIERGNAHLWLANTIKLGIMNADMSPFMRFLIVALLFTVPILVMIFQRWEAVEEIIQSYKRGESPFSQDEIFSKAKPKDIIVCSKCYSVNPPDHQFCGYCGAPIHHHDPGDEADVK